MTTAPTTPVLDPVKLETVKKHLASAERWHSLIRQLTQQSEAELRKLQEDKDAILLADPANFEAYAAKVKQIQETTDSWKKRMDDAKAALTAVNALTTALESTHLDEMIAAIGELLAQKKGDHDRYTELQHKLDALRARKSGYTSSP